MPRRSGRRSWPPCSAGGRDIRGAAECSSQNMRRQRVAFGSMLSCVVAWCAVAGAQQMPAPLLITDDDSYAVYAEVIGRTATNKPLRVSQETITRPSFPGCDIRGRWEPEWKPVVANFIEANSTRHLLLPNRPLGRTYSLFRWVDTYKRFPELREGDWRGFYAAHGVDFGGLWSV